MDEKGRQLLIDAARLFLKYGIRSLAMDDIARELGISKKTLYTVCDNKADLIDKILQYHLDETNCIVHSETGNDRNAIDVLLDLSHWACSSMKDFSPSHIFELQKYYGEAYKKFMDRKREEIIEGMKANLAMGISQGLYRDDLDVNLTAMLFMQNLEDLFDYDFLSKTEFSYAQLFQARYDIHIRSIVTPEGLAYFEKRDAEKHAAKTSFSS